MKVFILLAILFFSWRVFSNDGFYYEGRYYKIDEYIRSQDDPGYEAFLKQKKTYAKKQRVGLKAHYAKKKKEAERQERSRLQYLAQLDAEPSDKNFLRLQAAYEKNKKREEKRHKELEELYLIQKYKRELENKKPTRSVASFEKYEPRKRIPRSQRKYFSK